MVVGWTPVVEADRAGPIPASAANELENGVAGADWFTGTHALLRRALRIGGDGRPAASTREVKYSLNETNFTRLHHPNGIDQVVLGT